MGRLCSPQKHFPFEPTELLKDMRSVRVHGAAITHNESREYSYVAGDRKLSKLAQEESRLFGVATLPPTFALETGKTDYLNNLLDNGFRGVRYLCGSARDLRSIAEALTIHGLPLFYPLIPFGFDLLEDILENYRELNVIVLSASWSDNRRLFPLLERHDRLYFEYSRNQANDILEITKKHFGIERVLFGTGWPYTSMGALKSLTEYAVLSEDEKDAVAHKNACRLLNIDPALLKPYDDADCEFDTIAAAADCGSPMPMKVIDCHTHMTKKEDVTPTVAMMLNSDCEKIAQKLDRLGVSAIITAPWEGIATDGISGNEQTVAAAVKYPGRFLGWNTCNINYPEDLQRWRDYFEKYPDIFVGIKPYWPYQKFSLLDERLVSWLEYADSRKLLLLLHTDSIERLGEAEILFARYPNITFVLAHAGSSFAVAEECVRLANARENVVLELTYTTLTRGMVEYLVREVGADKVLYGSDLPMRDPSPQLGWVAYARIPEEDKAKILSVNIQRLLALRKANPNKTANQVLD